MLTIKLRNFIGIQTVRLWIIRLKYQTLPNLKVWTPMLNLMVVTLRTGLQTPSSSYAVTNFYIRCVLINSKYSSPLLPYSDGPAARISGVA